MRQNKSIRHAERDLKKYTRTAQILAQHTDIVLDDYEVLFRRSFEQGKFGRINLHAASLLSKLGIDPFQSREELCGKIGDDTENMVHLLLSLRYLANPGLKSGETQKYYKLVQRQLKEVREELQSTYTRQ